MYADIALEFYLEKAAQINAEVFLYFTNGSIYFYN